MIGFNDRDGRGESVGGGQAFDLNSAEETRQHAKGDRDDYLLFGAVRTTEGYKVTVSYVSNGFIVETKYGADQLKHHALAMVDSLLTQYIIDSYNEPKKFFDTVQVR